MVGCGGCGGNKVTGKGPHVYVDHEGKESEHPSEVSALAAKVRNGNRGMVRPK